MRTAEYADLLLTGARVRSGAGRWSEAVAVRGGRIAAVGTRAELAALAGPRTRVVDAGGHGLVVPGFQDAHVHAPFAGRNRLRLWLNDLAGRQAYLDAIAEYARTHPDEPWIVGGGWAMEYFPGGTPRKEDLDAIVPDRPVFLFNRDVHGAWVNSKTLEMAGITGETPDPADGRIERDPATGEATGTVHEGVAYRINEHVVPEPTRAEWEAAILNAQEYLHGLGITGWQDAWVTPQTQAAYETLAADGRLTARVAGALWWERTRGLEQIDDLRARREQALKVRAPGHALGSGFHPTTIKIMTDGILENHTGALFEPYCDGCGGHGADDAESSESGHGAGRGLTYVEPELLAAALAELDAAGFQVHMHAIGDRAVHNALNAVAAAKAVNGPSRNRHHIAHVQVIRPSDIARFAELDVIANCQAYWAQHEPQMDELTVPFLGPERAAQQYPFASLLAAGTRLAMGSDWAVTTANPLEQLEVAVTRIDPEHRDNPSFLPLQRLTIDQAFDAFTAGSAYVNHDDQGGRIEPGARADLVLLDTDVFDPEFTANGRAPIADAKVKLTIAAGEVVYEA
ncbi:amidohydrolase [Actinospica sp. MGRD01-02]|uniref:Amidohydrolase n=1 Tax=Actinospica acidithermotolerans TaxID=2828514 RepID=A0A941E8Z3_9ACTN|nr:amidohydrolase [Actinospica acidithermotolerans]MBR7828485.1 amidohydrolase [Actinospica acidithermotolerans]